MSHDPRHWSRSPERSGPIRNFMGAAEGGAAAGPSPAQQAVDMGYRVVDAHIQQGRDQARQRTGWPMMDGASPWGGMGGMGGMGDMSWVLRPWMSMAEMWMRMLMAPGAWLGGMSGPMGPAQGRHGSFFDGPSPSYGVTPPDGTHAQPPGWRPLSGPGHAPPVTARPVEISAEIHSARPVRIDVDVDLGERHSVPQLRALPLPGVRLESHGSRLRVLAVIGEEPAGRYEGEVVDARDQRRLGTLAVEILEG